MEFCATYAIQDEVRDQASPDDQARTGVAHRLGGTLHSVWQLHLRSGQSDQEPFQSLCGLISALTGDWRVPEWPRV